MKSPHGTASWVRGVVLPLLVAAAVAGCSRIAALQDQKEERDPLIKRAIAMKKAQRIDDAIELCMRAEDRKPSMARGHLELALLYDEYKKDYIRAIYHYQRYLELRPNAEKRKLIEDLIRRAQLSFAASLPEQPSAAVREISLLRSEIDMLKHQLDETRQAGAEKTAKSSPSRPPAAASTGQVAITQAPVPEPAAPPMQRYTVQSGDTLHSIAARFYGDGSKYRVILDGNRSTLRDDRSLRTGQVLLIPRAP